MGHNSPIETLSTPDDEALLRAQGHEQELPRQFSTFSAISFAFVVTNSWIGYAATFPTPLMAGGGPALFAGVIAAAVVCSIITLGMAELASAFPSSGGQYHFAFMVSSAKTRAASAFVTGWLSCLAWCLTATSPAIFFAQGMTALVSFCYESYSPTRWQTYLVCLGIVVISTAIVCFLPRLLPKLELFLFWCSILGLIVSVITILAMSHSRPKQSVSVVFNQYDNVTGWPDGLSFLIGLGSCMYVFLSTDAATHIAEEVPNPGRNIPRAMWLTAVIGIITTLIFLLTTIFATTDLEAVVNSTLPILTLYHQATGGKREATIFFTFWILLNYFGGVISSIAATGRLTWAFARDNGLPLSTLLARVHPAHGAPINATIACAVFTAVYGFIYIGSTTAFNSIISMSVLSLNLTYAVPQGIVLFRGRDRVLPSRPFKLGRFGVFANAFSCLWVALFLVIFCLPVTLPVEASSMNYLSPVAVGIVLLILAGWYGGKRKSFSGPKVMFANHSGDMALNDGISSAVGKLEEPSRV